jgi:hypothetical protein
LDLSPYDERFDVNRVSGWNVPRPKVKFPMWRGRLVRSAETHLGATGRDESRPRQECLRHESQRITSKSLP